MKFFVIFGLSCAAHRCLHSSHIVAFSMFLSSHVLSSINKSRLSLCAILEFLSLPTALITLDRRRICAFLCNCLQETYMCIVVIVTCLVSFHFEKIWWLSSILRKRSTYFFVCVSICILLSSWKNTHGHTSKSKMNEKSCH